MENDVLYNRIMNVVHEEYGSGSTAVANPTGEPTDSLETIQIGDDVYSIAGGGGGVLTCELTEVVGGYEIGASFNDLKEAFLSGKKIIAHFEKEIESAVINVWSNLDIIESREGEFDGETMYFIDFTFCVNGVDLVFSDNVEDPTADITVTSSQ